MYVFLKPLKPRANLAKLVKEGAVIVDVRQSEFQGGHIEGSKNIPLGGIEAYNGGAWTSLSRQLK